VVHYQSPARCLLILSMNYTSSLTAGGASGPIFPVYGSLTGVLVNPDASVVEIRTQRNIPSWARLCQIFGVILIIFALIQSNLVMNRARS